MLRLCRFRRSWWHIYECLIRVEVIHFKRLALWNIVPSDGNNRENKTLCYLNCILWENPKKKKRNKFIMSQVSKLNVKCMLLLKDNQ